MTKLRNKIGWHIHLKNRLNLNICVLFTQQRRLQHRLFANMTNVIQFIDQVKQ